MFAAHDPHPLFFMIPVLTIIVLVILGVVRWNHSRRVLALIAAAARWNGRVFNPGMFGQPHAELSIAGTLARVQYTNVGKRRYTEFTIHFPDPLLRFELYPQTIIHQVRKLLGMQDIEIGARRFDDMFIIQGNNPDLIREFLTRDAQEALCRLANFPLPSSLHLYVGGGSLRIMKQRELNSEADLLQFVSHCEWAFNALSASRLAGIEYLPSQPPSLRPDTHCQVCGEGLGSLPGGPGGKIVYCIACQTPHHLDCWQYIGHCSVYACGQKRYRAAR